MKTRKELEAEIARLKARKPYRCWCGEKFKTARACEKHRDLAGHGGRQ